MASASTEIFLGIDVGSVSTKMVALNAASLAMMDHVYLRTHGDPLGSMRTIMKRLSETCPGVRVRAAATTGSGRHLAARLINTGIVKNEITTHTLAGIKIMPEARTIVEIGGQDSKIILLKDGMAVDFAMNTVCAAGTGSFLDQQAGRLGIKWMRWGRWRCLPRIRRAFPALHGICRNRHDSQTADRDSDP